MNNVQMLSSVQPLKQNKFLVLGNLLLYICCRLNLLQLCKYNPQRGSMESFDTRIKEQLILVNFYHTVITELLVQVAVSSQFRTHKLNVSSGLMVNQSKSRLGEDSAEFSGSTGPSEGYNLHSMPLLPPGKLFKRDQSVTLDIFALIIKS